MGFQLQLNLFYKTEQKKGLPEVDLLLTIVEAIATYRNHLSLSLFTVYS